MVKYSDIENVMNMLDEMIGNLEALQYDLQSVEEIEDAKGNTTTDVDEDEVASWIATLSSEKDKITEIIDIFNMSN